MFYSFHSPINISSFVHIHHLFQHLCCFLSFSAAQPLASFFLFLCLCSVSDSGENLRRCCAATWTRSDAITEVGPHAWMLCTDTRTWLIAAVSQIEAMLSPIHWHESVVGQRSLHCPSLSYSYWLISHNRAFCVEFKNNVRKLRQEVVVVVFKRDFFCFISIKGNQWCKLCWSCY